MYEEKAIDRIPVGALGLVPLESCNQLAQKVDGYLVNWRHKKQSEHKSTLPFVGYEKSSYIVKSKISRFGSGEAKGEFEESIRGMDLFLMVDVCNYSLTYSLSGMTNRMSPDDHYQDLKRIIAAAAGKPDLEVDAQHMMVISPDEGGMRRAIYFANMLGLDVGMFYKRRDYSVIVDGTNPIIAHEYLGSNVEGKDVVVIDDMISSGGSMLEVAKELKERKAKRVFVCATFGLFTNGLKKFDEYYEKGLIDAIFTTNLIYQTPELLQKPYYINVDMSKYIALIIDSINHDVSLSELLTPISRVNNELEEHRKKR